MAFNIHQNLIINSSKEKVFNAFTQPEHLNNWWTLKSSGKPELEFEYNLNFTDTYNWYSKVLEVKENETFYLKMTKSDQDWNSTIFGIHLKEVEHGTLLEFSHKGWKDCNNEFKTSSFCWAMLLNDLKNYLEKGVIVPFEDRN